MPTRQATLVSELVADALDLQPHPDRWTSGDGAADGVTADPRVFAQRLADAGRRDVLTYVTRELGDAAIDELLDAAAVPLILVLRDADRFAALIVRAVDDDQVEGVVVGPEGREFPFDLTRAALMARLGADRALGDGGHLALVPLVGPAETAARDDGRSARGASRNGAPEPDDTDEPVTPFRRLLILLALERRDVGLVYLYASLAGLFSLTLPLAVQMLTNLVMGGALLQPVILLMVFVVAGTLVTGGLQITQLHVVETIQQRLFARHALDFAFRVPQVRTDVALSQNLPELMNRFFDVIVLQKGLTKLLTDATTALLTIIFGLLLLMLYHPWFIGFGVVLMTLLSATLYVTGRKGLQTSLYESKEKYRLVHWLEETARMQGVFKNAGRSTLSVDRADRVVAGWLHQRGAHFRILVRQTWAMYAFKALIVGALLVLGAQLVVGNQITIGQFVGAEVVIVTVLAGIEKLSLSLPTIYDVLTSLDKIAAVPALPLDRPGGSAPPVPGESGMRVDIRGLHHRYPGAATDSLRGVELQIASGERIALTGFDGAGQTTLLRVLAGLTDDWRGTVTLDGASLHDLDHAAVRECTSAAFDNDELFAGTLEENLRVGRADVSRDDVHAALEAVGLRDWMDARPGGLASVISSGGRDLGSSVATRLVIARAIASRPRLLVLDNFFQGLESRWRRRIIEYLVAPERPWTLVVVAHDPHLLAACGQVALMADGAILRRGTYAELRSDPAFAELVPAA